LNHRAEAPLARWPGTIARRLPLALAFVVAGCSFLINVDHDQCKVAADCAALGLAGTCQRGVCIASAGPSCDGGRCEPVSSPEGGGGGSCSKTVPCTDKSEMCFNARCVAKTVIEPFVCAPDDGESDAGRVSFSVHVQEFISQLPPKNLVVSGCNASDATCEHPVATFKDTKGDGNIQLDLPYGFAGFLEYRSDDVLTALWYLSKPLIRSTVSKDLLLVAPSTLSILAGIALGSNTVVDSTKGLVILEAFDCTGTATGGIHFETSKPGSTPFFIVNGLPSTDTDVSVFDVMDGASGGFLNVDPGFTIFSARIGVDGPVLGQYNTSVRANAVTYLDIHP
jgi:hypothetical protein